MEPRLALEEIYDAAFDDEAFAHVLERVAQTIGARSYIAGWHFNDQTATLFRHSGHWSDAQLAEYNTRFAFSDVWNVAAIRHWRPNRANDMTKVVPDREFENSTLYNEFLRPIGDDTYRVVCVATGNRYGKGALGFHRGRSQTGFDPDSVRSLDRYAGHLGRVLALRGKFSTLERRVTAANSILDTLAQPLFLVSGAGRLLHANAAGEAMLSAPGGLILRQGALTAASPQAAKALNSAIDAAVAPTAPVAGALVIPCSDGDSLRVSVIAAPSAAGPRNVLITAVGTERDETVEARLRGLYGLSPGEAQVAAMLAEGDSPAEIAEERRVTITTVRTQIKAVSLKLGCRRAADVVRIVNSLTPLRPCPA